MSQYIDRLGPNTTVFEAFMQIHTGATRVVSDLDRTCTIAHGFDSYKTDIPGTPLELRKTPARSSTTSLVVARIGSLCHQLLRLTEGDGTDSVAGFRNSESGSDYTMIKHQDGFIICLLGGLGMKSAHREPIGRSRFDFGQEVHRLKGQHRDRFDLVASGTYQGLQLVRDIKQGKDPATALRNAGRQIK